MTDLKISCEFDQSRKKQPDIYYAINFSYDSHNETLVSQLSPSQPQKQTK